MSMEILRGDDDAPLRPLEGRVVAILGFGNQGHAHALNLRESGVDVIVGNRPDTANGRRAVDAGFDPVPLDEASSHADLVIMALPDEAQPQAYRELVEPSLRDGATVGFLHGFNIHYGFLEPDARVGVVMVAPKGPGATLRRLYREGRGLPCLFAVHHDTPAGDAEAVGLAWANGIGAARAGIVRTTFAAETETDLFGEQAVLCGGLTALIRAAFETLCAAGYPPELAYLECCHEVKQVADLVYERGPAGMYDAISTTAEFGAHRAAPRLAGDALHAAFAAILREVRDGTFAAALREDHARGGPWLGARRDEARRHPLEKAGHAVRALMPWLAGPEPAAGASR